jgi:hypothetical protein
MKQHHPTGLGEPLPEGKLSLFQPPRAASQQALDEHETGEPAKKRAQHQPGKSAPQQRIRTTIDLTSEALVILQQVQQEHRLRTGRALPIWKALSLVISAYSRKQ